MNADKTSVFIGVYRRSSAAIHVLAFFSNLARWRVILLRLLTLGALIRAPTVREGLPPPAQYHAVRALGLVDPYQRLYGIIGFRQWKKSHFKSNVTSNRAAWLPGGTIRTERAASPREARISAICSSRSRRRLPFTFMTAPHLVESASTSSATRSWSRREVIPGHLIYQYGQR